MEFTKNPPALDATPPTLVSGDLPADASILCWVSPEYDLNLRSTKLGAFV